MKTRKKFCHLNQEKRDRLEALLRHGEEQTTIARILKVDKSTISREAKRHQRKDGYYDAETAQHKARIKRMDAKYQGMKVESLPEIKDIIIAILGQHRSPDEIAGRLRKEHGQTVIGKDAIYRWLYSPYGQRYCRYLCTKRYKKRKQKKKAKRVMIPNKIPLGMRPIGDYHHAEADTAVSPKRAKTSASALVICEKRSQLLLGRRLPNLKPSTVVAAMNKVAGGVAIDTITMDNGQENRGHEEMRIQTYFCDPRSPWQKPHVEVNIGLLRRWFVSKKTDWQTVSERQLQKYLKILNGKYRKSLNYRSAYEVAYERGIIRSLPPRYSNKDGCI